MEFDNTDYVPGDDGQYPHGFDLDGTGRASDPIEVLDSQELSPEPNEAYVGSFTQAGVPPSDLGPPIGSTDYFAPGFDQAEDFISSAPVSSFAATLPPVPQRPISEKSEKSEKTGVRNTYARFTDKMLHLLEAEYLKHNNEAPPKDKIEVLALSMGFSYDQVRNWFYRRKKRPEGWLESKVRLDSPTLFPTFLASSAEETHEVENLLDESGGLRSDALAAFKALCSKAKPTQRVMFLLVLTETKASILTRFAEHHDGVTVLDGWLQQSKLEGKNKHILLVLDVLAKITISLKLLQDTQVGKTVNKLTKATESAEVSAKARALVDKWKKLAKAPEPAKPTPAAPTTLKPASFAATPAPAGGVKKESSHPLASVNSTTSTTSTTSKPKPPTKPPAPSSAGVSPLNSLLSPTTPLKHLNIPENSTKRLKQVAIVREGELSLPGRNDSVTSPISHPKSPNSGPLSPTAGPRSPPGDLAAFERPAKRMKLSDSPMSPTGVSGEDEANALRMEVETPSATTDDGMDLAEEEVSDVDLRGEAMDTDAPAAVVEEPVQISAKTGKPKKRVSWPSDDKLVQIREFTKDDETPSEAHHTALKQDAINEGAQLRIRKQQEEALWKKKREEMAPTLEWYTPDRLSKPKPFVETAEAEHQQRRNEELFTVFYTKESEIPPSPKEPPESSIEIYDDMALLKITADIKPLHTPIPTQAPLATLAGLLGTQLPQPQPMQQMRPPGGYQIPPHQHQASPINASAVLNSLSSVLAKLQTPPAPNPAPQPMQVPNYGNMAPQPAAPASNQNSLLQLLLNINPGAGGAAAATPQNPPPGQHPPHFNAGGPPGGHPPGHSYFGDSNRGRGRGRSRGGGQ